MGMLPSAGYRTQLRHIFMTMSSRKTTISCVQYCRRHGLLVNTAVGSAARTSSVMQSGIAGLPSNTYSTQYTECFWLYLTTGSSLLLCQAGFHRSVAQPLASHAFITNIVNTSALEVNYNVMRSTNSRFTYFT